MEPTLAWLEDPKIFGVNKEKAHSDHPYFQNEEEMIQKNSAFFQSLNGSWKFSYAQNPAGRIKEFYQITMWAVMCAFLRQRSFRRRGNAATCLSREWRRPSMYG